MKHAQNPNRRPSVGKGGTAGCFVVEVTGDLERKDRFSARRFLTEATGKEFFDRTCSAHQAKANRERRVYGVFFYETAAPKNPTPIRGIDRSFILPL